MSITAAAFCFAILINAFSFGLFWQDKRAARTGRRTSEQALLSVAMCGGSLGAVAACRLFRHKTRKEPFRTLLRLIITFQLVFAAIGILTLHTYLDA
ncbi:DUF1294 domain-containing protein [Ensifer sp. MJa1]